MSGRGPRLDRFLCEATGLSRRLAQLAIRGGEVNVDGAPCTDPSTHVHADARVEFRGEPATAVAQQYWMLHKPAGVVCAARDSTYRTVLEFVKVPAHVVLHVVGRLDVDATGLVLLTDDGEWSHRVTSPRYKVAKVYRVTLAEPLNQAGHAKLHEGVVLKDEPKPARPALLERLSDNEWRVTITEGRYHQVKRMFAAVGNHVVALHRERIGAIALDPTLASGESRPLTAGEVASFGPGTPTPTT
jgi:16S rRNA pseudouridine516 synthase